MSYKFETLQLHVGQEKPDPATDARAVPIYALVLDWIAAVTASRSWISTKVVDIPY